jgi:hypothetical protein
MDNGEEVGGGVFALTDETTDGDAYADAFETGEAWLQSRSSPPEIEGARRLQDAMIDIESLGTTPGSAVLSIGAVMFGQAGLGDTFYAPVDLQSCTAVGLTIDPNTIAWWMQQSDAARAAAFRDDAEVLAVVLYRFTIWFTEVGAERPWCHGATFDVPLLEAAYKACGMVPPWKFWNVRDTRTLYDLGGVKVDRTQGTHHNALDDARAQAETAVIALQRLQDARHAAAPVATANDEQDVLNDYDRWITRRGPLGPGALAERPFIAGWLAGKRRGGQPAPATVKWISAKERMPELIPVGDPPHEFVARSARVLVCGWVDQEFHWSTADLRRGGRGLDDRATRWNTESDAFWGREHLITHWKPLTTPDYKAEAAARRGANQRRITREEPTQ